MKPRFRPVLIAAGLVLTLAVVLTAATLSYNAPCTAASPVASDAQPMKAVVHRCYGSEEVLAIEDIERPTPGADEVLVKVHAAGLNPLDWHYMKGEPYIMRLSSGIGAPTDMRVGVDFAGVVEAVGSDVTRFKPGDEVFGGRSGAFGEYVVVREQRAIAHKPANVSMEEAGSVGIAAITALQALRDVARIQPGQHVLINGASGGVGTYAVQIAKALGAEVTGVCSTRNVELVRSLGADHVIDYKQHDFTTGSVRYDAIVDNVGNHSFLKLTDVLKPAGVVVMVGGPKKDPWLGPVMRSLTAAPLSPFVSQELSPFLAEFNQPDLMLLGEMMSAGSVKPVIDRRYPLSEVRDAMRYLETGRARGKIVVQVAQLTPQFRLGGDQQ